MVEASEPSMPTPSHCTPPPPEDIFDQVIQELLTDQSPHAYSTFSYFNRIIRQFSLSATVEPHDICLEAYLRGKVALRKGKVITNPLAWLKSTGYNIVRERYRESVAQQATDPQVIDFLCESAQGQRIQPELINEKLDALMEALQQLKIEEPEAAELLELQIIEGMTWEQIRSHLTKKRKSVPDVVTLRQRGCRAKKHLRRLFHAVKL